MRAAAGLLAWALEERGARVLSSREWPWASATFVGTRHRLRLAVIDPAMLDGIEEAVFDLGEHLLADLAMEEREVRGDCLMVTIEALTIEDRRPSLPARDGDEEGWGEVDRPTTRGTKAAFSPLAMA